MPPFAPTRRGLRQGILVCAACVLAVRLGRRDHRPASPANENASPPAVIVAGPPHLGIVSATQPPRTPPARPRLVPDRDVLGALALPPGEKHDAAFSSAFERWMRTDPASVTDWVLGLASPRDFDEAAALLVIHTDTLQRPTSLALGWAEALADPDLRRRALVHVFREWSQQDSAAALRYVDTAPSLSADDRATLRAALIPLPKET